jgi:Tfp pilus assembly protein PilX
MPVISERQSGHVRRFRERALDQGGFTMIVALGVMMVTLLLATAVFAAVQGDASLTRADLDGKRAYAAAQSGVQAYLYQLNANASTSAWWETCANDMSAGSGAQVAVPGSSTGTTYSYKPVPISPYTTCSTTDPVASLIDTATGTLRMRFTGYSGRQTRSIVASLKTLSPLSFLWYTKYETEDTSIAGANSGCDRFYWQSPGPPSGCQIYWVSGDAMNGPMYTQDQFLVSPNNSPQFGRLGSSDEIASERGVAGNNEICAGNNCYGATVSHADPNPTPQVKLPTDNANLLPDAQKHGLAVTGTVTLNVTNNSATGATCVTATSCTPINIPDLTQVPIIYAQNDPSCPIGYSPKSITYPQVGGSGTYKNDYYGPCGDIYVSGTYSSPLTLAAANDVIVTGNLTNTTDTNITGTVSPTGPATLGLVATQYVRVMHTCPQNPDMTIDAAILTLKHSFFVDNYECDNDPYPTGHLTVHGAIAQYFRGIVGIVGGSGYLKNYAYDQRLGIILPPYLFDLQNTEWEVFRETLCSGQTSSAISCGA